jgi:hypothetical protein
MNMNMNMNMNITTHEKHNPKPSKPTTQIRKQATDQIKYNQRFKLATLNCRGLNEQAKREQIIEIMHKHDIDILALQETKNNNCSEENKAREGTGEKYRFYFSAGEKYNMDNTKSTPAAKAKAKARAKNKAKAKPKAKAKANAAPPPPQQPGSDDEKGNGKGKRKGKGKGKGKGKHKNNAYREHHGVGFVLGPKAINCVEDCIPYNGKLMEILIANSGPTIRIINHHAPHSGRPPEEKDNHWEAIQTLSDRSGIDMPTYIIGDTNARIHGPINDMEELIIGKHTFGKGPEHVPNLPPEQRENRQALIDFCVKNEYNITNTYFEKPERPK